MSILNVDSKNFISSIEAAPDKLRAEIGLYYGQDPNTNQYEYRSIATSKIHKKHFEQIQVTDHSILPIKKTRIFIAGSDNEFETQQEWRDYCQRTIPVNAEFSDHAYILTDPQIMSNLVKEHHRPGYEDITKDYPTNQLLNYMLMSFPFKSKTEKLRRISDRKTVFDSDDFEVSTSDDLERSFSQFETRLENYSSSIGEIDQKQRYIFDLYRNDQAAMYFSTASFPFHYDLYMPNIDLALSHSPINVSFNSIMDDYHKRKNLFKTIKSSTMTTEGTFTKGQETFAARMVNLSEFLTTSAISNFSEGDDELFMLNEDEYNGATEADRFVNQLNTIRFFGRMRGLLKDHTRDYERTVVNPEPSKTVFIGYKIEKYLDRTSTTPLQTIYTSGDGLVDTQLKYGRKYFYKVFLLTAVAGTAYYYNNLFISNDGGEMESLAGSSPQTNPGGFSEISNREYKAYMDVTTYPSFQILEYEVFSDSIAFVDTPTLPPQVEFYGRKSEPTLGMIFRPNFFRVESVSSGGQNPEELMRPLAIPFRETDEGIIDLLQNFSRDTSLRGDYFSGIYEIYRMEKAPSNYLEFADNFLTTVDVSTDVVIQGREPKDQIAIPTKQIEGVTKHSNQIAHFTDTLIPHRRYYYLFRAITYHGTPSNVTITYEVELQRDSDEYKLIIKEYSYEPERTPDSTYNFKRLLNLIPNEERLIFTYPEDQDPSADNFKLSDDELFPKHGTRTIKLRITSKHTGKKIDLNLNFAIASDGSFINLPGEY